MREASKEAQGDEVAPQAQAAPGHSQTELNSNGHQERQKKLPDAYFELVKQFPLIRIRGDDHLMAAQQVIDRLLQLKLDKGGQEYLDVLTDLVEAFEDEHEPIPDASEAEVLQELMRSNGLSQSRLSKEVGIAQSTISAELNGTRSLTKDQIVALGKFFRVSSAAFLRC